MRKFYQDVRDFLYPPRCAVCRRSASSAADPFGTLCNECNPTQLPVVNDDLWARARISKSDGYCERCGEALLASKDEFSECVSCLLHPLQADSTRSVFRYTGRVEKVIKALKYGKRFSLAATLASSLAEAIRNSKLPHCDYIVPLPSAKPALQRRGFSHTTLLARALSRQLKIPLRLRALYSSGSRPQQVGLHLEARFSNARGAYSACPKRVAGKSILLVDDVLTTGASVDAAALALRTAGASSVYVFTLARSHQFALNRIRGRLENQGQEKGKLKGKPKNKAKKLKHAA